MTDQSKPGAKILLSIAFAAILQTMVIVLLTTDKISVSLAVPLLALVIIIGLVPAAAFIKSKK